MSPQRLIGMLIFPRLTQLDMTGPYEVLARLPNTTVHLVAHTLDPVKTDRGMMILPTVTYADCPKLDVVMVPGGPGQQDLMEDAAALNSCNGRRRREIRDLGVHGLARAGCCRPPQGQACHLPLGGDRASFAAGCNCRERAGRGRRQYRHRRRSRLRHRLRAHVGCDPRRREGGARNPARQIEYDPAPPFNSGSPRTASTETLEALRGRLAPLNEQRRVVANRVGRQARRADAHHIGFATRCRTGHP